MLDVEDLYTFNGAAGSMYLDSDMKIEGVSFGQIAVVVREGEEPKSARIIEIDGYISPEYMDDEQEKMMKAKCPYCETIQTWIQRIEEEVA